MREDYFNGLFKFCYENLEAQQSKKYLFFVTTENEDINVVAESLEQVVDRYPEARIIENQGEVTLL